MAAPARGSRLTDHRLVEGFWTSAMPEGFANSVQFLASGATPGLLQPGESGRVPVYYAGWQQPWDFGYPPIYFNLGVLTADNTNLVDWVALKDDMRPSSLTAEQWEPVFWNLVAANRHDLGRLREDAQRQRPLPDRLGERVTDIRELLGFEVMQASGLSVTRTLASAVDAQVQTPGLPLTFTRSFSTDIPSHFRLGRFGRGWSDNWDRSLTIASRRHGHDLSASAARGACSSRTAVTPAATSLQRATPPRSRSQAAARSRSGKPTARATPSAPTANCDYVAGHAHQPHHLHLQPAIC